MSSSTGEPSGSEPHAFKSSDAEGEPSGDAVHQQETIVAWRVTSEAFQDNAFDGEGARLYGGRWNSEGVPMTYLAGSLALAALEQLANLSRTELLEGQFVRFRVQLQARRVLALDPQALPGGEREPGGEGGDWTRRPEATRALGDRWARSKDSAALRVPSAVVPEEDNILLNPAHPDADAVRVGAPEPFVFDRRLLENQND